MPMGNTFNFESQHFAIFDNFYSTNRKTSKLFNGLVVGFGPKGRPVRMCDSSLKVRSYEELTVLKYIV